MMRVKTETSLRRQRKNGMLITKHTAKTKL